MAGGRAMMPSPQAVARRHATTGGGGARGTSARRAPTAPASRQAAAARRSAATAARQRRQATAQRGGSSSALGSGRATPLNPQASRLATPPSPVWSWRSRVPGDSGWDLLGLRKGAPATFNRFREVEVVHARWAMLGVISLLLGDVAGQPFPPKELTFASLANSSLLLLVSAALVESYRLRALWGEEDFEARAYPGKRFDPLGLTGKRAAAGAPSSSAGAAATGGAADEPPALGLWASWLGGLPGWLAGGWWWERRAMTEFELLEMKSRELRNGRLAMVSFIGCCMASALTGKGPITLLVEHLSDPLHHTVLQSLQ